jgi:hypothetical protein
MRNKQMANPYASPNTSRRNADAKQLSRGTIGVTYWNVCLAFVALLAYCTPFAAFRLSDTGTSLGRSLFPLAPLGLLTLLFCFAAGLVQVVLLLRSFAIAAPIRFHRLIALSLLMLCFTLWFIAVKCGWAIRV